jgi:hypothetical protein
MQFNTDTDIKPDTTTPISNEECIELKNIKYKTMLINGVPISESKSSQSLQKLDQFLEDEKTTNKNEPWCKLNKTIKIKKIIDYVEVYKEDKKLDNEETEKLIIFLRECLDRKKLQRIKDVLYDKEKGVVCDIPALTYIKTTKHFTLKNIEKRVSTLKSLPQKKQTSHGTIKNKQNVVNNDNSSDDEENA